jgi:hypothetical protein
LVRIKHCMILMQDLKFSQQWRVVSWSSGLWHIQCFTPSL